MKVLIVTSAMSLLASGTALAQGTSDSLIIGGRLDVPQAVAGGTGSVEWLRETAPGGVQLGALSGSRGGAWWTFGRAGGFLRRPRAIVSGIVELGGGADAASRFGYRRFDAELAVPLSHARVFLETEAQLAQMASDTRRIVRVGLKSIVSKSVTAGGSYYLVESNGATSPAVSARVDFERKPVSLLGGFVIARAQRTRTLVTDVTPALASGEIFGGCAFGSLYRILIVASISQPAANANRIVASLRVPLGSRAVTRDHR